PACGRRGASSFGCSRLLLRQVQEAGGVAAEDQLDFRLAHAERVAGAHLVEEVALGEAAREEAGVGAEDDALRAYRLERLAVQVLERERVGHPAHPLVGARGVYVDVREAPAQREEVVEVTGAEVRDEERDLREVAGDLEERQGAHARVLHDAASPAEEAEVDEGGQALLGEELPDATQLGRLEGVLGAWP